jgi:hypothetical protein
MYKATLKSGNVRKSTKKWNMAVMKTGIIEDQNITSQNVTPRESLKHCGKLPMFPDFMTTWYIESVLQ